jgi:hypothetical protein
MSLFRFEYETKLSLEECDKRLNTEYLERKERDGTQIFSRGRYWGLGMRRTRKGTYKLVSGDNYNGFVFIASLFDEGDRRRISCKHNPFRLTAWGVIGIPGVFLTICGFAMLTSPTYFASAWLWFSFALLFLTICGAKESVSRRIVNDYLEKGLEARPLPPQKRKKKAQGAKEAESQGPLSIDGQERTEKRP